MEMIEFKEKINKYLEKIQIILNEEQIKQFYKYMNLLIKWNEKINLTSITDPEEIILKHFVDSLTIEKYISKGEKVIDIGTGAGFPGIPLKIYRNDIKITLVDSLNKRINFLDEVIRELELGDIETIHTRAEDIGKNIKYRETFDVATSRAVANLSTLSEYLLPTIKINGKVICMKGSDIEEELAKGKKAIEILGGTIEKIEKFNLPNSDIKRNIIYLKKINKTPGKYPRKAGTPSKSPINN